MHVMYSFFFKWMNKKKIIYEYNGSEKREMYKEDRHFVNKFTWMYFSSRFLFRSASNKQCTWCFLSVFFFFMKSISIWFGQIFTIKQTGLIPHLWIKKIDSFLNGFHAFESVTLSAGIWLSDNFMLFVAESINYYVMCG